MQAFAGAFSAVPTTIVTTPMERIKVSNPNPNVVMQTQGVFVNTDQTIGGKKYKGMVDAGIGMYREGGVRSLYRGTIATLARVSLTDLGIYK
jgi:solute carrier family 25 (mitochondrial carnitine/acylcarnitine transporter), member 20/29